MDDGTVHIDPIIDPKLRPDPSAPAAMQRGSVVVGYNIYRACGLRIERTLLEHSRAFMRRWPGKVYGNEQVPEAGTAVDRSGHDGQDSPAVAG